MTTTQDIFGEPIYTYTRKQAINDGLQVSLDEFHASDLAEAGLRFPVYMTTTAYASCVCPIEGEGEMLAPCQDAKGRLWDVLTMLVWGIRRNRDSQRIPFTVMVVPNIPDGSKRHPRAKRIELIATVGPVDIDAPEPAITIMFPGEE